MYKRQPYDFRNKGGSAYRTKMEKDAAAFLPASFHHNVGVVRAGDCRRAGGCLLYTSNVCGIRAVKHGLMSINIVEVVKHFVHYMLEKIVWVL